MGGYVKVLDVMWFCAAHGNVGIVKVFMDHEGIAYFIGSCSGINEEVDKKWIADWGSRYPTEAGNALFGGNNG